jgi:hypothetical protein
MPANDQMTPFLLALDEIERAELLHLLERELSATHVEARRTQSPAFQDEVHQEESVLRAVIQKLRAT